MHFSTIGGVKKYSCHVKKRHAGEERERNYLLAWTNQAVILSVFHGCPPTLREKAGSILGIVKCADIFIEKLGSLVALIVSLSS